MNANKKTHLLCAVDNNFNNVHPVSPIATHNLTSLLEIKGRNATSQHTQNNFIYVARMYFQDITVPDLLLKTIFKTNCTRRQPLINKKKATDISFQTKEN